MQTAQETTKEDHTRKQSKDMSLHALVILHYSERPDNSQCTYTEEDVCIWMHDKPFNLNN